MKTAAKGRLLAEMRQSPGKAIALGVGLAVAAVVWAPRLFGALGGRDPVPADAVVDPASPEGAPAAEDAAAGPVHDVDRREPGEIRREFIRVSSLARQLRALTESSPGRTSSPDPFRPIAPPQVETSSLTAAPAEEIDGAALEREAAREIVVSAIFQFGSRRVAILDGARRAVGERHGEFTVEEIAPRSVTLRGRFGPHVANLKPLVTEEKDP